MFDRSPPEAWPLAGEQLVETSNLVRRDRHSSEAILFPAI